MARGDLECQKAWADVEHAVKRALQLEGMRRLKLDYSLYGEGEAAEIIGTNEVTINPKKLWRSRAAEVSKP